MKSKLTSIAIVGALLVVAASAEPQAKSPTEVQVAQALANVLVDKDIGRYTFDNCEIKVRRSPETKEYHRCGVFVEYDDVERNEINIGIGWFSDKQQLNEGISRYLKHYKNIEEFTLDKTVILRFKSDGDENYMWSDGEHFLIKMEAEGIPSVPSEIAKAYLAKIPSKITDMKLELNKKDSHK